MTPELPALAPLPSGSAYHIVSPPASALVTRELANELGRVLERFARDASFSERNPVRLFFRPGVVGHHQVGRAADLYAVDGQGLDQWKQRWDESVERATRAGSAEEREAIMRKERAGNLGWRLYKTLQLHGRWARPAGYPVQLFGPWTRTEGPWRLISDRLLQAHRDHLHVAR